MTQRGGTTSVTAPQAQPHRNKRFDAGQVRVGVVGTSWWADSMYLPALAEHPAGRCVAVCGRNEATATELAERWNVPLVTVINNNSALGQGLRSVKKLYEKRDGNLGDLVEFEKTNFADLANVFGITSFRVERAEDIRPIIEKAIALREPVIIDVVTDPDSNPEPAWIL